MCFDTAAHYSPVHVLLRELNAKYPEHKVLLDGGANKRAWSLLMVIVWLLVCDWLRCGLIANILSIKIRRWGVIKLVGLSCQMSIALSFLVSFLFFFLIYFNFSKI